MPRRSGEKQRRIVLRCSALAALLILYVGLPEAHAQQCEGVLLQPVVAKNVNEKHAANFSESLDLAVQSDETLRWASKDALANVAEPEKCVRDAACLSKLAQSWKETCVVGILIQPASKPGRIVMRILAVDIGQAKTLADDRIVLRPSEIQKKAQDFLSYFWTLLPEPENRVVAPVVVPVEKPSIAVKKSSTPPVNHPASRNHRLRYVEVSGGSLLPRAQLSIGALVGIAISIPVSNSVPITIRAGFDWTQLVKNKTAFVMPGTYPAGQASLTQRSRVYGLQVGVGYRLASLGFADVSVDAGVGATLNDSTFEAFNMSVQERGIGPLFTGNLSAIGELGPALWLVKLGWRESWHSLGDSGRFGENVVSGFQAALGIGVPF